MDSPAITRRSLLITGGAGAAAALAVPAAAMAAGDSPAARRARLKPGGRATLKFPSPGGSYAISATVTSAAGASLPFVTARFSQPGGAGSQKWTLGGAAHGQSFKGTGPCTGTITIGLQNADYHNPVTVSVAIGAAGHPAAAHDWRQVTNRAAAYDVPGWDAARGVLASVSARVQPGDEAYWAVPLRNVPAKLTARAHGPGGFVYLASLDPDIDGLFHSQRIPAGKTVTADVQLPMAPVLLTLNNEGSREGQFSAKVTF